ncbi:MAG: LamG domain-containing protein [Pirellulaceae bacterium]
MIIRLALLSLLGCVSLAAPAAEPGLVGHWKLRGDGRDHSGNGHHGIAHNVDLAKGTFNGTSSYLEVPSSPAFDFGTNDFSITAWIHTEPGVRDVVGDLVTRFDPATRIGLNLTINAANPGYNSQGDVRHIFFGIDHGTSGSWSDCGRPGGKAHSSDSLTVFNGELYAGTTDGPDEADWAHVYRYRSEGVWEDCGRLGTGRTRGVYAMIVHDGSLYAATSASHGRQPDSMSYGRVYRFRGGQQWEDLGQPGQNYRLNSLASFRGKLYVAAFNIGPAPGHCYVYAGDRTWRECGEFEGWPHTLAVHDDRLYAAYPQGDVFAYDGTNWENLGNPLGSKERCTQIHAMGVYGGELYAGTWPTGNVAVLRDKKWVDLGRLGDATETVGLTVYNGSLYAGTIPRAELFRFDGPHQWTSIRRLFDPPGFKPVPVGESGPGVADWSRASSFAVFRGKLFVSTATCYRTNIPSPLPGEPRGNVFALTVGTSVSVDRDLGPGSKHIAAVRKGRSLMLYVDGELAASCETAAAVDLSNDLPLLIGHGPQAHFRGAMNDVRLYNRALAADEVRELNSIRRKSRNEAGGCALLSHPGRL